MYNMATSNFKIKLPPQTVAIASAPHIEQTVTVCSSEVPVIQPVETATSQDTIVQEQFVPKIVESPTPVRENFLIEEYNQMSMPATPSPQFNMLVEPTGGYRNQGYDGSAQHILTKVADGFASAAQDSHALSGQIGASAAATGAAIDRSTISNRDATERVGLSVLSATERNGSDTRISVERTAANGMATTERNGGDTRTALYQNTQGVLSSSERNGGDTRTAVYQNGQGVLSSVERNGADTRASVYQGIQSVLSSSERNGGDTRTALYQQSQGLSSAVERNGGDSRLAFQQGFTQLGSAVERNGGETRGAVQQSGGQVASAVERNGGDTRTAISQAQGYLSSATERNGGDTRAAVVDARSQIENHIGDTRALLRSDIMQTMNAVDRTASAVAVQVAAGSRDQLLSAKDIQIQQLQVRGDMLQFVGTGFSQGRTDLFQVKSDLAMQLKEAELEALKTEQRLSKQLAECCCEIKEKVDMNSCAIKEKVDARATITDVLIKDTEASRLKDDLYFAREKYLFRRDRRDRSRSPPRGRDGRDGRDARRSPSPRR
jgi:hypothetical protein